MHTHLAMGYIGRMAGYDTIIVGAGSADCVLANRMGEDTARRILLARA
jgi:choline dehydrogenase-like flavoprotein